VVLLGGLLVGFAAGMVLLASGRVAGVSGMVSSVVRLGSADASWQALFLVGLTYRRLASILFCAPHLAGESLARNTLKKERCVSKQWADFIL